MNSANLRLQEICRQYQALLIKEDAATITVAVAGAPSPLMLEALQFTGQRQISVERWPQARLEQLRGMPAKAEEAQIPSASVTALVDQLLLQAFQRRASDIHIEPGADGMRVRLRIDGVMQPGNDSNLLIVFYVQIMPDDLVMQFHRF